MTPPRVVVVGAGPAGVRAAQVLVEAGVRPIVIDEGRRDGGQIYRPANPTGSRARTRCSTAARPRRPRRCTTASMRCASTSSTAPRRWRGT